MSAMRIDALESPSCDTNMLHAAIQQYPFLATQLMKQHFGSNPAELQCSCQLCNGDIRPVWLLLKPALQVQEHVLSLGR